MKDQKPDQQVQRDTIPQQVWMTLTSAQQQTILQTIVQICQHLVMQWQQEAKNESVPKR